MFSFGSFLKKKNKKKLGEIEINLDFPNNPNNCEEVKDFLRKCALKNWIDSVLDFSPFCHKFSGTDTWNNWKNTLTEDVIIPLDRIDLSYSILDGMDFSGTSLEYARFNRASLCDACFYFQIYGKEIKRVANINKSNFSGADLKDAYFCNLDRFILIGFEFNDVINAPKEVLDFKKKK